MTQSGFFLCFWDFLVDFFFRPAIVFSVALQNPFVLQCLAVVLQCLTVVLQCPSVVLQCVAVSSSGVTVCFQ